MTHLLLQLNDDGILEDRKRSTVHGKITYKTYFILLQAVTAKIALEYVVYLTKLRKDDSINLFRVLKLL